MAAVWMRVRAELRTHWAGMVGLVLLTGVAGGAVMTAAEGARHTDSTLARVERAEKTADVLVNPDNSDGSPAFTNAFAAIDHLPGIKAIATVDALLAVPLDTHGHPEIAAVENIVELANPDGALFHTVGTPHVISGRLPDPTRADEVLVDRTKARQSHLRAGDHILMGVYDPASVQDPNHVPPAAFTENFVVTGIGLDLDEASRAPDDPDLVPEMVFTPALARKVERFTPPYVGKEVLLTDGSRGVPAFEAAVRKLFDGVTISLDGQPTKVNINFQEPADLTVARARRAVRPYVLALWLFAALAALAGFAVIAQAVARGGRPLREERSRLAAIGFTRGQVAQVAAWRGLLIGVGGALVACVVAIGASPRMCIGPLREIDPGRGITFDWLVLGVGSALILLLVVASAVVAVRRSHRVPNEFSATVGDRLARSGTPVPIVSGVRFALDRGRDGTVPLRSTLIGITIAIAALVATLVYGAGLTRFTSSPVRYGWPWSYQVSVQDDSASPASIVKKITGVPGVLAAAAGKYSQFDIRGTSVAVVGIDDAAGLANVPVLRGHAPSSDDEIVLGTKTLDDLHLHVGDSVAVNAQGKSRTFHVVGTAVFARFAPYQGSEPTGLGIGAATTAHAIDTLGAQLGSPFFMVQTRPGAQLTAASLGRDVNVGQFGTVLGPQRPNDVMSYDRLSTTPLVLAGVLVLLALGSAIHLLVTGARSRRRDVALLKTIGVTRRQARAAVLVQATVLVGLALVVAVPLGMVAGRWLWLRTADWLGIASDQAWPVVALLAVVLVAIALANLIAFVPATIAARTRPAVALRSE